MEEDDNDGKEVNATSTKELANLHSGFPFPLTKQEKEERSKQEEEERKRKKEENKQTRRMMKTWIRKKTDADGYFLLQLEKKIEFNDMFLTAEDASSLTIASK